MPQARERAQVHRGEKSEVHLQTAVTAQLTLAFEALPTHVMEQGHLPLLCSATEPIVTSCIQANYATTNIMNSDCSSSLFHSGAHA